MWPTPPSWPSFVPSSHLRSPMLSPDAFSALKRAAVYSPSTCPLKTSCGSAPCSANTENLMLEDPALRTTNASAMASGSLCAVAPPLRDANRDAAGCEPRHDVVGAAGENDRHARP